MAKHSEGIIKPDLKELSLKVGKLAADMLELLEENDKLKNALVYIKECFEAAETEGLQDKLINAAGDPGALVDLVERRLMFAFYKTQEILGK